MFWSQVGWVRKPCGLRTPGVNDLKRGNYQLGCALTIDDIAQS